MAITHLQWGEVQRPWGYEVRVDLLPDALPNQRFHEVLTFPRVGPPATVVLNARIVALKQALAERLLHARADRLREIRQRRNEAHAEWLARRAELIAEGEDPDGD